MINENTGIADLAFELKMLRLEKEYKLISDFKLFLLKPDATEMDLSDVKPYMWESESFTTSMNDELLAYLDVLENNETYKTNICKHHDWVRYNNYTGSYMSNQIKWEEWKQEKIKKIDSALELSGSVDTRLLLKLGR